MARTSSKPSPRRSRSERGATTRALILEAVVLSIDEVGLARTTTQRIAREAGVSVGAVQHHFPARADLLAAVLERSAANFAAQFDDLQLADEDLRERIHVFAERAWRHYGSAAFRSTLVILSDRTPASARNHDGAIHASARRAAAVWNRVFAAPRVADESRRAIRDYAFASLAGLAMTNRLQPDAAARRAQIGLFEVALAAVFATAKRGSRASGSLSARGA